MANMKRIRKRRENLAKQIRERRDYVRRRREDIRKRELVSGIDPDDSPMLPLGFMVEKYLVDINYSASIDAQYPKTKCLATWYILNYCLMSNAVETERLLYSK